MNSELKKKPICIGTGLIALDVVMNGNPKIPLKLFAGGSCGNVLTILSYLNWESFPIARLKTNNASFEVLSDLSSLNVNLSLISQTLDGSTPIIIQRIKKDKNGNSIHHFEFKNPDNGEWLPSYKPVLASEVESIITRSPIPSVFYFDRVSRAAIDLAKHYKNNGSVIFFEPSSVSNNKQFEECLCVADIVKFSSERIKSYTDIYSNQRVPLEIETLGKDGLRYRFSHSLEKDKWKSLPSYKISYVADAAGSGDWFSAGLISQIAFNGALGFKECNDDSILKAIKFGQALGALNCFFDGARGLMYALTKRQVEVMVRKIQSSKMPVMFISKKEEPSPVKNFILSSLY